MCETNTSDNQPIQVNIGWEFEPGCVSDGRGSCTISMSEDNTCSGQEKHEVIKGDTAVITWLTEPGCCSGKEEFDCIIFGTEDDANQYIKSFAVDQDHIAEAYTYDDLLSILGPDDTVNITPEDLGYQYWR